MINWWIEKKIAESSGEQKPTHTALSLFVAWPAIEPYGKDELSCEPHAQILSQARGPQEYKSLPIVYFEGSVTGRPNSQRHDSMQILKDSEHPKATAQ